MSLRPIMRSPYRNPDGSLSEAVIRGATFFVGNDRNAHRADSRCVTCHVPETGFVDFKFHDVGQRRPGNEEELSTRDPKWHVNTKALVGIWTTPPYEGVSTWAESIIGVIRDQAARADDSNSHGTPPDGLLGGRSLIWPNSFYPSTAT